MSKKMISNHNVKIITNKNVEEVWDQSIGSGHWNLNLVRSVNDWEVESVVRNFAK